MFQFRIRTLVYLTTLVAALVLMFRDKGPTFVGLSAFALYLSAIAWYMYRNRESATEILPDESEREKWGE